MSEKELKELSELLNDFRETSDEPIYYRASDFDLLKAFTQCAINGAKRLKGE